jgi:hypothetical protein
VGYLIDRAYESRIVPVLEAHGITVLPGVQRPKNEVLLHFHETERRISESAFQGVFNLSLSGSWKKERPIRQPANPWETREPAYPWGSEELDNALYIPMNQPLGRLAFYLLDPRAPDGLVFWGFFHSSFIRGRGMWGEWPKFPILALGTNAAEP